MKNFKAVAAVDSFKGSLTSIEAGEAVKRGILRACPDAEVTVLPLADGGEGTIDSIAPFIGGISKTIPVSDPLGRKIEASYIFDPDSHTAYIEMAKAAGLTLLKEDERDPYLTTTFGVGELMRDAIANGAEKRCRPIIAAISVTDVFGKRNICNIVSATTHSIAS